MTEDKKYYIGHTTKVRFDYGFPIDESGKRIYTPDAFYCELKGEKCLCVLLKVMTDFGDGGAKNIEVRSPVFVNMDRMEVKTYGDLEKLPKEEQFIWI